MLTQKGEPLTCTDWRLIRVNGVNTARDEKTAEMRWDTVRLGFLLLLTSVLCHPSQPHGFVSALGRTLFAISFESGRSHRLCRRGAERQREQRVDCIFATSAPLPLCGKPNVLMPAKPEMRFANRYCGAGIMNH